MATGISETSRTFVGKEQDRQSRHQQNNVIRHFMLQTLQKVKNCYYCT